MLAQRLRELEEAGVVARRTLAPPAASRVYQLTEWGSELAPVLLALGRWGSRAPMPDPAPPLGADAAAVALQTTFDPAAAAGVDESYALCLGDQAFVLRVADGRLDIGRAPIAAPAVSLVTDTATLAAVLWHGRPLRDAVDAGLLAIEGDPRAAARLVGLFAAPVPV